MIPLRDNIDSRRRPVITVLLIVINVFVFFQELSLDDKTLTVMIQTFGLVPSALGREFARHPFDIATYLPLVTNLFLHGGWLHLISNMWYLWLFGDNVEDFLGKARFLWFYVSCGLAANLTQLLLDAGNTTPIIGASGAISGVLGAYLVTFPWARILTFVPLPFFPFFALLPIPALFFLAFWFLLQIQQGTLSLFMTGTNVAWWAHIGGFLAGIVLAKKQKGRSRRV